MNLKQALEKMTEGNPELAKRVQEDYEATEIVRTLIGLRAKAGVSEKELSDRTGWAKRTITRMEHLVDGCWSINEIYTYCQALGIKVKLKLEVEDEGDQIHQL